MKFLLDLAIEQGFVLVLSKHLDYSTMVPNGIRSLYKHSDGREICWGLNEAHKPPTLCFPRPKITKTIIDDKGIFIVNEVLDDCMNEVLNKYSHEEILEAMFNKEIIFNL